MAALDVEKWLTERKHSENKAIVVAFTQTHRQALNDSWHS